MHPLTAPGSDYGLVAKTYLVEIGCNQLILNKRFFFRLIIEWKEKGEYSRIKLGYSGF